MGKDLMEYNSLKDTLLICIGNEFRKDDGIGLHIADHPRIRSLKGLNILKSSLDGFTLIEAWKSRRTVLIIDAVHSGSPPGTVFHFDALTNPFPVGLIPPSVHKTGIPECISLARIIGFLPEKMTFYGIEGEVFGQGKGLSSAALSASEKLVEMITSDLRNSIQHP